MSGSRKSLKKATVFNPRASNNWSKDESKFGQKMLEKMGWKQGQGIGLNNQGITENIKVRLKLDSKGLGYQIKEDQWLEVRSEFSEILSQLSQGVEDEGEAVGKGKKSLEAVSQSSKTRVHYHKFTHGKDIARYKREDLIGILGKKEKDELIVLENKEFIQSGNMDEYFKSKKRKLENGNLNLPPADDLQLGDITDHDSAVSIKSVKKKKKLENNELNLPSADNHCEILDHNSEDSLKSVKKKKKLKNSDENLPSADNSEACDILDHSSSDSKSMKKKKTLETGDENLLSADNSQVCDILESNSTDSKAVKKKKKKLENGGELNLSSAENSQACDITDQSAAESVKSVKKTKKLENNDQDLPSVDSSQPCNIVDHNSTNSVESVPKKNLENSKHNLAFENSSPACDSLDPRLEDYPKSKKKKLGDTLPESNKQACGIVNHNLTDFPKSKKKKLENNDQNHLSISSSQACDALDQNSPDSSKIVLKKTKKLENIDQNLLSASNSQACDILDQNSPDSSKIVKKKKKKLENTVQNVTSANELQACNVFDQNSGDGPKSKEKKPENSYQNLSSVNDSQACDIPDQNSADFTKTAKKKKKKKTTLESGDHNLPSANTSQTSNILNQNSAHFMKSVIDYNSGNNIEEYISKFEKNREELLNKYREKYKKRYLESSSDIKVFGDDFDGRKLDCKKPESEDTPVIKIKDVKNMSKAGRIVAKVRLLKSIEEKAVTHNFEGSNLTSIAGYGKC